MPELDFMVVADYVRTDAGVLHMVGAGFDAVRLPAVPGILIAGVGSGSFWTSPKHASHIRLP